MFWFWNKAINVSGTVEGVYVNNVAIVACNYGIFWSTTAGRPLIAVQNSHIAFYTAGVDLTNCAQATIQGNLLYHRSDATGNGVGVDVNGGCSDVMIINNQIFKQGSPDLNAIVMESGATRTFIESNKFSSATTGIWVKAGATDTKILDNEFNSSSSQDILDSGTNTTQRLIGSATSFRGALAYKTAAQSISNSTWTTVTFDAEDYDTSSIYTSGSPTRMTVPTGVTRIRLAAQISMQNIASGECRLNIKKNGVTFSTDSFVGGAHGTVAIATPHVNVTTPVITVSPTDYFEVECWQSSGSAKNIASNAKNGKITWFTMEIIE
jgi:hypothetical protein